MSEFRSPPHMPIQYFQTKLQTIQALEQGLADFPEWVENYAGELFYQFTGESNYRFLRVPYDIASRLPNSNNQGFSSRETFSGGLQWFLQYLDYENPHDWARYLPGMLPFGEKETVRGVLGKYGDDLQEINSFLQKAPELVQLFQSEAQYLKGGAQYDPSDNWPTVQEAVSYVQRAVKGFEDIRMLLRELQDLEVKVKAMIDQRAWAYSAMHDGSKLHKRDTKPIEVLYHATGATSDILKDGLKTRKELGGSGKVGGGVDDLISFTSDPQIAISIANALLTAVKIAKGELTFDEIVAKAAEQGIDMTTTQPYRDLQMDQEKREKGWEPEGEFAYQHTGPEHAFRLFRFYLGKAQEKGILYDPFFASVDARDFLNVKEEDVGVIACRVKMDDASFESGMEEFRVSPSDVLRCKRLNVNIAPVL